MQMRRLAALATLAFAATGGAIAEDNVVNVYNWSDYIDESILTDFEKETGIKVVYDVFDSNDILETKLLASGTGYDIVVPTASFLQRQIEAGVFQKLDKSKLPNIKHMWDMVLERTAGYDPGNQYAINYMWGTTGIGYNVDKVKERLPDGPTDSWKMVLDPANLAKLADCGVYMLDASDEMIPAALNYIGEDPRSQDPAVIAKAEAVLMAIRPHIRKFHSSEYINALANGDICVAIGWSGDMFQARDRAAEAKNGVTIQYVIPKEGALMWFDMMAIPSDAPHVENAHKFLDYIMRPEVAAKASNYVSYANGNKGSQQFITPDLLNDPAVYPPAETQKSLYTVAPYPPKVQRIVTRLWTKVKSGGG